MFNQRASDQERHQILQELIKKDFQQSKPVNEAVSESDSSDSEEDEFYSDEQLNELIARTPVEFAMFQQIDSERYK